MPKQKTLRPYITKKQEAIYMNNRNDNKKQEDAAKAAKISVRSGRDIEKGRRKPRKARTHSTRKDPFEGVWESVCIPLLEKGIRQSTIILKELQRLFPREYPKAILRTLQRRIKKWKALKGKGKEVIFRQVHIAGRLGLADFTHPNDKMQVTIQGKPLTYILFHFRLAYSGYSYIRPFEGSGESFTKFGQGLNEALEYAGGVPQELRTDSLSAAFKNLSKQAKEDLTRRFKALAEHVGLEPSRINRGKSHENGSVESPHRHFKDRLEQRLIIRGSYDFRSFKEFEDYVWEVLKEHNDHNVSQVLLEAERTALKPLPLTRAVDYDELVAVVSCAGTMQVKRVTYSVPSRLIGERLHVRLYNDRLEGYLCRTHTVTLPRLHPSSRTTRARRIQLEHVIESLVRKPRAFLYYIYRDDILPNDQYKFIWNHLISTLESRAACKLMVGLLYLVVKQNCTDQLANVVIDLIKADKEIKLSVLQDMFTSKKEAAPSVNVSQHSLSSYNELIPTKGDS